MGLVTLEANVIALVPPVVLALPTASRSVQRFVPLQSMGLAAPG
jgi:hypothetical protein